jgi:transposase InsO family protein
MTDNGPGYLSVVHKIACRTLGLKHIRTRPYRPRTNGKAERFIRTMLGGWAYGAIYADSADAERPYPAGSTTTIADNHTAASATKHPWPDSTQS